MTLVETVKINHTITVFHLDGIVRIRLQDDSGEGSFVDPRRVIQRNDDDYSFNVPLETGYSTPCSTQEVVYLLSQLPMAVEAVDEDDVLFVVEPTRLPASDRDRLLLIQHDCSDARAVSEGLANGRLQTAPDWWRMTRKEPAQALRSARALEAATPAASQGTGFAAKRRLQRL